MAQVYKPVTGREFIDALCKVLGLDPAMTSHIVIDIPSTELVMVYVQGLAPRAVLEIVWPPVDGQAVTIVNAD